VAETPAVVALRVLVGRVGAFNGARSGAGSDRGAHRENVSGVDRDYDGGGSLALPGSCVGVEVSVGKDANVLEGED